MTDKPIIFSPAMVRALLDGTKTQTRRLLKPDSHCDLLGDVWKEISVVNRAWSGEYISGPKKENAPIAIGDRLWVRENWRPFEGFNNHWEIDIEYPADNGRETIKDGIDVGDWRFPKQAAKGNVPSIHMPRWASRITLEVTDVRVERLQDISNKDAKSEGVELVHSIDPWKQFRDLWDSLNADRAPWSSNPWVVAYSFKVQKGNIDQ